MRSSFLRVWLWGLHSKFQVSRPMDTGIIFSYLPPENLTHSSDPFSLLWTLAATMTLVLGFPSLSLGLPALQ